MDLETENRIDMEFIEISYENRTFRENWLILPTTSKARILCRNSTMQVSFKQQCCVGNSRTLQVGSSMLSLSAKCFQSFSNFSMWDSRCGKLGWDECSGQTGPEFFSGNTDWSFCSCNGVCDFHSGNSVWYCCSGNNAEADLSTFSSASGSMIRSSQFNKPSSRDITEWIMFSPVEIFEKYNKFCWIQKWKCLGLCIQEYRSRVCVV